MKIVAWAESHPWEAGGAVFAVGVVVLYFLGAFKASAPATSNDGSAAAEAYFAAQSQQAVAGDELQATQINAQAQTAQTGIVTQGSVDTNNIWATENLATTQSNNATSLALAPYQTEADYISGLTTVASDPGTVLTNSWNAGYGTSQSSGGILGGLFGAGSSSMSLDSGATHQTFVANQGAAEAAAELASLGSSFSAGGPSTGNHAGS